MIRNKKWMTLLEIVITITILSILYTTGSLFYNTVRSSSDANTEKTEVYSIQSALNQVWNWVYDLWISEQKRQEEIFSPGLKQMTPVYYKIPYSTLVLLWDGAIMKDSDDLSNKKLTIGIQKCNFFFDPYGNNINWEWYSSECDPVVISMLGWFNIQWYIIWNNWNIQLERNEFMYNSRGDLWYTYQGIDSSGALVYDNNWLKDLTRFATFDILLDNPSKFFQKQVFVFSLKDNYYGIVGGVYFGKINELAAIIKQQYIVNHLNNAGNSFILESSDLKKIFTQSHLQLFYNQQAEREPNRSNIYTISTNF